MVHHAIFSQISNYCFCAFSSRELSVCALFLCVFQQSFWVFFRPICCTKCMLQFHLLDQNAQYASWIQCFGKNEFETYWTSIWKQPPPHIWNSCKMVQPPPFFFHKKGIVSIWRNNYATCQSKEDVEGAVNVLTPNMWDSVKSDQGQSVKHI